MRAGVVTGRDMFLLCLTFVTSVVCNKVIDSSEDISPDQNATTTLYPITNKTEDKKIKSATSWKIETAFAESKIEGNSTATAPNKPGNTSQEFRPSPHVGFLDEGSWEVTSKDTFGSFESVTKKQPVGFVSSKEEYRSSFNKIPKELYKPQEFPLRVESPVLTRTRDDWRPTSGETRTADEGSSKVPAGGLYKFPDAFKEKPGLTADEDFGLEFSDHGKDSVIKKRHPNPWQRVADVLTALIPVGLIVSALTPSIITIEPTGPGAYIPGHILRRADGSTDDTSRVPASSLPLTAISERCRRRLLCELHSDHNYTQDQSRPKKRVKQCYRIRCEDPEALAQTLAWRWLLSHHPGSDHYT